MIKISNKRKTNNIFVEAKLRRATQKDVQDLGYAQLEDTPNGPALIAIGDYATVAVGFDDGTATSGAEATLSLDVNNGDFYFLDGNYDQMVSLANQIVRYIDDDVVDFVKVAHKYGLESI